ncbi:MAG: chemotaxis protein CheW, partial [Gammaproteobacteria bacterium]|nr:chemotaxis protein CheW [Gammaproteobacteria bacterium]
MYAIEQNESILIFRVGAILCSVPVRTVDSIVVTPSFHCLPKQAPSVVGVFRYRDSSTVPAVDLHSKFGLSIDPDNPPPRTIVSNGVHGLCGFMVDEVMEITTLDDENWSQPPKFISDNVFDKTLTWREHLVLSTDFDRLRAMKESVPLQAWAAEKNESLLIEAEEGRTEFAADVAMSVIEADHADDAPVIDGPVAEGLAAGTQALDPMEQALDVEPVLEEANAAQAEHLEDLTESPVEEPEVGIES